MKTIIIGNNDAGQRLDKFLAKALPSLPKSLLYKYIRLKRIKLNGKRCEAGEQLNAGSELSLYINDEFFIKPELPFLQAPANVPIVYEDNNLLLADKPAGLVVHEDESGSSDTLINRILHYLYQQGAYNPAAENSFTPALCNRIDRNTSGIVIAAKNFNALTTLNQIIKNREIKKYYLCLVHGVPEKKTALLKGYHVKDEAKNQVQITAAPTPGSKTALTKYKLLKTNGQTSLLEVELLTGRTHQIRAHLAAIGHPLVGDAKYGTAKRNKQYGLRFQALYAHRIVFDFKGGHGALDYLNGMEFKVPAVPFEAMFL